MLGRLVSRRQASPSSGRPADPAGRLGHSRCPRPAGLASLPRCRRTRAVALTVWRALAAKFMKWVAGRAALLAAWLADSMASASPS